MEQEEVLDTAIQVGYGLLCSGAEVYRVEESIAYICKAYGMVEVEAFAIPSSIVVTISDGAHSVTKSKRVKNRSNDLDKIEKMAGLSRWICEETPDYQTCREKIDSVLNGPTYSKLVHHGAYMVVGFVFTRLFGGNLLDGCLGSMLGFEIVCLQDLMNKMRANSFFINILCGFMAAFTANLVARASGMFHADKVVIGTIMLLVPGLAIANSMRDFISSDTMTGMSRLFEALFIAVGVALGVAFAMKII